MPAAMPAPMIAPIDDPAIAATLLSLQEEKLGIDYMDRRAALIEAVTLDQVKAVAAKLLTAEPAVLVIGPPLEQESKG